ncbi:sister chromatid cohesion protein PDS5-like A isoform X1 [Quillaja saponaria]|uniref:Sister chromatid cohesion protein PDS5-like A isoform X1 n=1 Tax=Quillaja saponaria TaxID=32244 RepID=A0AAD7LYU3_QUISA|nr:sister chromatid cohesion protein PDS5-like A isoform X1 [Quillaja saponaria]
MLVVIEYEKSLLVRKTTQAKGKQHKLKEEDSIISSHQVASALSQLEPPSFPESTKKLEAVKKLDVAIKPLKKAIVHGLLQHDKEDVRLLVAICVTEIFRVMAPEPPFEEKDLRETFKLIISMFAELANTTNAFFLRRVKILETIARCKCCVIMLDIDCNDLVLEMFSTFFSVVRLDHHKSLIDDVSSIMLHILNEEASWQLVEVILRNLLKGEKGAPCAASQLAASIIRSCADKLEHFVCGFLTSCILDRDAVSSELKETYHEIILQVFQCAPEMLLAVIPGLIQELLTDQVDVRIKAVDLVGELFALPGHRVPQKYHDLFVEFLRRFSDKSAEVRVKAVQCAKAFYVTNLSERESHEIISALEDRLLDFDDKVRTAAVIVSCDLSRSNLKLVPSNLISQTTERLRDKKVSVRKVALRKLIEVYQDYCNKCSESNMTISDLFEQIPCKILMLCYDGDCNEFRAQNLEFVLGDYLFPTDLSVMERTRHWIHLFSLFSPHHKRALDCILTQKRRLQNGMRNYLAQRKKDKENVSGDMQKRTESFFTKMAASFPDPELSKAVNCFKKLNKMNDSNIFNSLAELLDELTFETMWTIRDKFLKMERDKDKYFEFLSQLSSKCSYNIFNSEHVRCILDYLSTIETGNKHLEDSSMELLLVIISNFPSLLKGSERQFQMFMEQKNPVNEKLIKVLATAGPHISVKLSDIYPFLEKMCLEGTRSQAKCAVSAIAALIDTSKQPFFPLLYEGLIDMLYTQRNIPTVLQSLGCIAQHSASVIETRDKEITSFICQKIFRGKLSDDLMSFDDAYGCSSSCKLKIYGMKTLVKSFLPHQANHVRGKIKDFFDILLKMLQETDTFVGNVSCERDKAHIRLAAAKSILRLSRRWDLHITPEIFRCTITMAKDSSSFVRRSFLNKTHKMLKERALPIRYGCAFGLATMDCIKDLQEHSFTYMDEFIKEYSREARNLQNSSVQGAMTNCPAYILVFLIHILAHDSDFPPEGCLEETYARFCSPLFLVLLAFVKGDNFDGKKDLVKDTVSYLFSILRAVRRAEDVVDVQITMKLHMLADIGIFILKELDCDPISSPDAPQQILLPSSLYKANSKRLTNSSFDECFLIKVLHVLKSNFPLPAKSLPKRGRKCQEDDTHLNINNNGTLDKPVDLSTREIINAKSPRPDTTSGKREKKAVFVPGSGSVSLHECSTFDNPKFLSKKSGENFENNQLSSCDSASLKASLPESLDSTHNLTSADYVLEDAGTSCNISVGPLKCSRTNSRDPCSSKENLLAAESNKSHLQLLGPLEPSFPHSLKKTVVPTGGPATKEEASLNQKNAKARKGLKNSTVTSESEVINMNIDHVVRTTRKRK